MGRKLTTWEQERAAAGFPPGPVVQPGFVDYSLRRAMTAAWPGVAVPAGRRLCLGAGRVSPHDWVCVDSMEEYPIVTDSAEHAHIMKRGGRIRADVTNLSWVMPDSCAVVYAHHVLEHLDVNTWEAVLRMWSSKLIPGGFIYLCQPDLASVCARVLEGIVPGSAESWFSADPRRTWSSDVPRTGLSPRGLAEGSAWFMLYAGGHHVAVPSEAHVRDALEPVGVEVRRMYHDLEGQSAESRLLASMEGCYIGRRTAG